MYSKYLLVIFFRFIFMHDKKLIYIFFFYFLSGCGGGGSSPTQVVPTSAIYNYEKNTSIETTGGSYDVISGIMSYRTYPETGELWVSTGTASMQMSYTVDGTRTIAISRDYSFLPEQGSTNLDMSMDFQQTLLAGTVNFDVGNDLDSYLFWESDWGISTDPISQNSYEWNFRSFSFYTDVMLDFLGTEYVNLFISDIDYGDDSTPQFDLCNVVDDDCIDNIKDKDVIAGVFGDFTGVGDMPSSGSQTYNVKAIAFWHPNKLESLSSIPHWPSYEGNAMFTANFETKSFQGSLLLDYVFPQQSIASSDWDHVSNISAGVINISANISNNQIEGASSWKNNYGSGDCTGYFFGPNAGEFGGWCYVYDDNDDDGAEVLVSFIGT